MMEGASTVSNASLVQQDDKFAGDKDDPNNDMNKSVWMVVGEDLTIEPEKLETSLTQVRFSSSRVPELTRSDHPGESNVQDHPGDI